MTLSKDKSKTEGEVQATLTHFTPNSQITLRWEDGSVLGTTQADASGNAVATFRTPSAPYGTYLVTAEDVSGFRASAHLSVIPRVKITKSSVTAGTNLRVYVYGYVAETEVEILISGDGEGSYELLDSVVTGADGSGSHVVTIPASTTPGEHTILARPTTGERRSASDTIVVTAAEATPAPDT
jgi:5'-nucleotidase